MENTDDMWLFDTSESTTHSLNFEFSHDPRTPFFFSKVFMSHGTPHKKSPVFHVCVCDSSLLENLPTSNQNVSQSSINMFEFDLPPPPPPPQPTFSPSEFPPLPDIDPIPNPTGLYPLFYMATFINRPKSDYFTSH